MLRNLRLGVHVVLTELRPAVYPFQVTALHLESLHLFEIIYEVKHFVKGKGLQFDLFQKPGNIIQLIHLTVVKEAKVPEHLGRQVLCGLNSLFKQNKAIR